MRFLGACAGVTMLLSCAAFAQDRLPEIPPDKLSYAQREAARSFQEDRGVPVFGPFVPLLRSPQLMLQAMSMGDYLRFNVWDVCAGQILVEEARGRVTDAAGDELRYAASGEGKIRGVLASNGVLHDRGIDALRAAIGD